MSESLPDNAATLPTDSTALTQEAQVEAKPAPAQGEPGSEERGPSNGEQVEAGASGASEKVAEDGKNGAKSGNASEEEVDTLVGEAAAPSPKGELVAENAAKDPSEGPTAVDITTPAPEAPSSLAPPSDTAQPASSTATPAAASSILSPIVREGSPASRTSTPPLGSGLPAKKKFSSVNVNKQFLSKAASPAPAAGATKTSALNGRPAASPVPITSSASRHLSTKLSTIPASSKPTPSPSLPAPSLSSSPWAKPSPTPGDPAFPQPADTLHQPAPTKPRLGSFGAGLGGVGQGGLGIAQAAAAGRSAWKVVGGEARGQGSIGGIGGGANAGLSRDFPTAKEVADGQKKAQLAAQAMAAHNQAAAQAVAAHNQAILQGLNAFTQLDPNAHRWDEEDEEDDVIDFGDTLPSPHFPTSTTTAPPPSQHRQPQVEPSHDRPVSKSERFAEDFDRSWPRRPAERERVDRAERVERVERDSIGGRRGEESRVLFNASSNRLEAGVGRQSQGLGQGQGFGGQAPPRLMSRPTTTSAGTGRGGLDRALPPHLQGLPSGSGAGAGSDAAGERMLPPHMAASSSASTDRSHAHPSSQSTGLTQLHPRTQSQTQLPPAPSALPIRSAWGRDREPVAERAERGPGSWLERRELPSQSSAFEHAGAHAKDARSPEKQAVGLPRRSFSQTVRPAAGTLPPPPTLPAAPTSHPVSAALSHAPAAAPAAPAGTSPSADEIDPQAAEMHTAAEKARLRRLAEEAERDAAAERARMKAKALEERLRGASGAGGAGEEKKDATQGGRPQPPPGLEKSHQLPSSQSQQQPQVTLAQRPKPDFGLPPLPAHAQGLPTPGQGAERQSRAGMVSSWRARAGPKAAQEEVAAGRREILSPPTGPRAQQGPGEHTPLAPPSLSLSTAPSPDAQTIIPGGGATADPTQGKKESSFDGMLARIQAAMKEARERESAVTSVQPPLPGSPEKPAPQAAPVVATVNVVQPTVLTRGQGLLGGRQLPPHQSLPAAQEGAASAAAPVQGKGKGLAGLPPPPTAPAQAKQASEAPKAKPAAPAPTAPVTTATAEPTPAPAPPPLPLLEEFFDVTCVEPPRSPPPAWRTYTIKIPKGACSHVSPSAAPAPTSSGPASAKPQPQAATVAAAAPAPKGWAMSFEPAIDGLNPATLSLSELLLPEPVRGRFAKPVPIVSISPRTLEKVEKKGKKRVGIVGEVFDLPGEVKESGREVNRETEGAKVTRERVPSPVSAPAAPVPQVAAPAPAPAPAEPVATTPAAVPDAPPRKTKSPVKTSAAAKAEREGRFGLDGVSGVAIGADRALASGSGSTSAQGALSNAAGEGREKPLVRFTVSSELEEGERQEEDSLLDEVNKMSLERVEEGDDKKEEGKNEVAQGAETPKTPPAPSSPKSNGSTTPWSKAPLAFNPTHTARSASQHDHALRSVWDASAPSTSQPTTSSTNDASTPMYPTLNAPSSADPPAQQPLSASMKTSFSHSHAFPSPGVSAPTLSSASSYGRHPSAPSPYAQFGSPHSLTSPESGHNLMALSYSSMSRPGVAVGVNQGVNGFQQGVWSPTAFGTSMASPGYAYSAQQQQQQQQPGKMVGGNYQAGVYAHHVPLHQQHAHAPVHVQQQQPQLQHQQLQHQPGQQQPQYGAPGYGRGQTTPGVNVGMYGYGYGAPGQAQMRPHGGRFSQAQANGDYQHQHQHQPGVVAGQAVGGVGVGVGGYGMAMDGSSQGAQVQGQGYYGGMYPQGQAVGAGVGSPRMQQPPGYGRQHGAGAVGQQGRGVGARKW
ncbi:hypothetical protein IAT38_003287 [Cryptococcus sp. DSM 104549]